MRFRAPLQSLRPFPGHGYGLNRDTAFQYHLQSARRTASQREIGNSPAHALLRGWPAWAAFRMAWEVWAEDAMRSSTNAMIFPIGQPDGQLPHIFIRKELPRPHFNRTGVGIYNVTFEPELPQWHVHRRQNRRRTDFDRRPPAAASSREWGKKLSNYFPERSCTFPPA